MVSAGRGPLLARAVPSSSGSAAFRRFRWFRSWERPTKVCSNLSSELLSSSPSPSSSQTSLSPSRTRFFARSSSDPPAHTCHDFLCSEGDVAAAHHGRNFLLGLYSTSVHKCSASPSLPAGSDVPYRSLSTSVGSFCSPGISPPSIACNLRTSLPIFSLIRFFDTPFNFTAASSPLHVVPPTSLTEMRPPLIDDLSSSLPISLFSETTVQHRNFNSLPTSFSSSFFCSSLESSLSRSGRMSFTVSLSSVHQNLVRQAFEDDTSIMLKSLDTRYLSSAAASPRAPGGEAPAHHSINVPSLGDSIVEGNLLEWRKKVGDPVAVDDVVCVIETDKITVEIHSDCSGVLISQAVGEGAIVHIGEQLAVIDSAASAPTSSQGTASSPPSGMPPSGMNEGTKQPQSSSQHGEGLKGKPGDEKASIGRVPGDHRHHSHHPFPHSVSTRKRVPLILFKFAHRKRAKEEPHLSSLSHPSSPHQLASSSPLLEFPNGAECSDPVFELWGVPRFQPLSEEEIEAINLGGASVGDRQGPGEPSYIWTMELTMKPNPALSDQKKKSSASSSGKGGKGSEGEKKMTQKN
ncbi:dihydrolipoamide acyltransferase [Cystoisospora suis]|uniref:Dihydrolipoamide acyltransferase n=1 Tax=Cystoisospora suis TaxID=483139 RepID=A0A2C6LGM7_9APIC|nr:dihydrolipoamide acyltransferase [Cystoisospora suis]